MLWDVFISHASEDKVDVARPLATALESAGLRVWLDEAQLKIGQSLSQKLSEGLSQSRFGVVILSRTFSTKSWTQRELGAFLSRTDAILPVWHRLESNEIGEMFPLLADLIAASTSEGIPSVAGKILEVAGKHLPRSRRNRAVYTSNLSVREDRVRRGLEVLESLSNPATLAQLEITAEGYPQSGWMGTDSPTLVEVLYGFSAPLVEYRTLEYSVRRNLALLDTSSRLQFALLEAALETFFNEGELAAVAPAIEYGPRVPGWRTKRMTNPARYWWQGISPDRFDAAMPFFLRPDPSASGADPLLSAQEFADVYRRAFASTDDKIKETLGLLANGLYGFSPAARPVLWRICVSLARVYQAFLGNSNFDPKQGTVDTIDQLYRPKETNCFPFQLSTTPGELYEPYAQTLTATLEYLESTTLRRIRAYLSAPREAMVPE
jgi:hypothetical protein